jgi:hypothetical protein
MKIDYTVKQPHSNREGTGAIHSVAGQTVLNEPELLRRAYIS